MSVWSRRHLPRLRLVRGGHRPGDGRRPTTQSGAVVAGFRRRGASGCRGVPARRRDRAAEAAGSAPDSLRRGSGALRLDAGMWSPSSSRSLGRCRCTAAARRPLTRRTEEASADARPRHRWTRSYGASGRPGGGGRSRRVRRRGARLRRRWHRLVALPGRVRHRRCGGPHGGRVGSLGGWRLRGAHEPTRPRRDGVATVHRVGCTGTLTLRSLRGADGRFVRAVLHSRLVSWLVILPVAALVYVGSIYALDRTPLLAASQLVLGFTAWCTCTSW